MATRRDETFSRVSFKVISWNGSTNAEPPTSQQDTRHLRPRKASHNTMKMLLNNSIFPEGAKNYIIFFQCFFIGLNNHKFIAKIIACKKITDVLKIHQIKLFWTSLIFRLCLYLLRGRPMVALRITWWAVVTLGRTRWAMGEWAMVAHRLSIRRSWVTSIWWWSVIVAVWFVCWLWKKIYMKF